MAAKKKVTKKTTKKAALPKGGSPLIPSVDITAPSLGLLATEAEKEAAGISQVPLKPEILGSDSEKRKKFREFAGAMNKERRVVAMADEASNVYELRRPTGIIALDKDIGGGFPAGGMSVISGPDNAGKTWLCMRAVAMHQRLYGPRSCVAVAVAEGAFDYKRALQTGVVVSVPDELIAEWNQERIHLNQPEYTQQEVLAFKRQIGEVAIFRAHTGEELMNVVLEAVKANIFGIIVVDSFSVLMPEADLDKDVGETPKRAGNANLMTDFIRKYTPYTSGLHERNETTLIGIMQVRANDDKANAGYMAKYLKDWKVTGAFATKHSKLVDVQIWDGSPLKHNVMGQQVVYGKPLYWKIEKGKAGCHDNVQGEAEFRYDLPQGHDDIWGLIVAGTRLGVFVEAAQQKIEIYNPITRERTDLGGYKGLAALARVLAADFEFELQMRYWVLAASGVQCLYRPLQ